MEPSLAYSVTEYDTVGCEGKRVIHRKDTDMTSTPHGSAAPALVNPATLADPSPNGYSALAIAPAHARLAFLSGLDSATVPPSKCIPG